MRQIETSEVAPSSAPLSQAIVEGDLVFASGQIPREPDGTIITGDIKEQTAQVMENLSSILEESGSSLDNVIKSTVFLTDTEHFDGFNDMYAKYMNEPYPARSAFIVASLARTEIDVEVEVIAKIDE
ncbi:RidA family protein [Halopenitus persicus]|uniref:RidA family protein n=1 Tax=Halopenitus persicus TaxID=1048396 RepID=UPI000BBA5C03|nr:Rid family detoxifying hydrolase [Halopenitus persicus]